MGIIQKASQGHRPEELAISFNGGKDNMVILHLLKQILSKLPQRFLEQGLEIFLVISVQREVDLKCRDFATNNLSYNDRPQRLEPCTF